MLLTVLIPAYNEEGSIAEEIKNIPKKIESIDLIKIIVIDDGSNDNTVKVAKDAGAEVYSLSHNQGLAKAIAHGFRVGIEIKSDILVILDADNQYDPKEINLLINPILQKKADIVIGDRQIDSLSHMPKQKKIGNKMVSKVLSLLIGNKILDAQTGFRAFNKESLAKIQIFSEYTYTQETLMQAKYKKLKVEQIPITFRKRNDESRLISNIFSYASRTISLVASTIIFYKSFRFFSILSTILFSIGILISIFVLNHYIITNQVTPHLPLALLAVLFLITGSISVFFTITSSISNRQSKLLEEILFMLKKDYSEDRKN